jgi:hypothetical protein
MRTTGRDLGGDPANTSVKKKTLYRRFHGFFRLIGPRRRHPKAMQLQMSVGSATGELLQIRS